MLGDTSSALMKALNYLLDFEQNQHTKDSNELR